MSNIQQEIKNDLNGYTIQELEQRAKELILKGANLNMKNEDGKAPVHLAFILKHNELVNLLIENKCDLNIKDNNKQTPLMYACKIRDMKEQVKMLIENGADIDSKDSNNFTALRYACVNNNEEIIKLLLENNAKVDEKLFLFACGACRRNILELMVDTYEADINWTDKDNCNGIYYAMLHDKIENVRYLLEKGLNVNFVNNDGDSPIHFACFFGKIDIVRLLISFGANINSVNNEGNSSLVMASLNGQSKIFKVLEENETNNKNSNQTTTLSSACLGKNNEIIKLLLENNAKLDEASFLIACGSCKTNILELMIDTYGADINWVDEDNCNGIYYAIENYNIENVKYLLEKGLNVNLVNNDGESPIHHACIFGATDAVRLLISFGANVNLPDKDKITPLAIVSIKGDSEIVKLLIENGALHDSKNMKECLYYALEEKREEVVKLFLDYEADINKKNDDDESLLVLAYKNNLYDAGEKIIKLGAIIGESEKAWIFHHLCEIGDTEKVKMMIEEGANLNHVNTKGRSCLNVAIKNHHDDIVDLLKKKGAEDIGQEGSDEENEEESEKSGEESGEKSGEEKVTCEMQ